MLIPVGATGVDFSSARPDPQQLADRGVKFVCRYVTGGWKQTSRAELDTYFPLGIGVVLNGETAADAALLGALRGSIDGLAYVAAAKKLGAPAGTCIVVSHDTSAWNDQVVLYFDAAFIVIADAGYTKGCYGSKQLVDALLARGHKLEIIWATAAVSWGGGRYPAAHIHQGTQVTLPGGLVDLNVCKRPFHAWHPATVKPPVVVPQEDSMRLVYTLDDLGIWLIDFTAYTIVHLTDTGLAGVYQKIGIPGNYDPATWISANELATLQSEFVGRPQGTPPMSGTWTAS